MRATSRTASRKVAGAGSRFFFGVGVQNLQFNGIPAALAMNIAQPVYGLPHL
jgi:hypothetical protein